MAKHFVVTYSHRSPLFLFHVAQITSFFVSNKGMSYYSSAAGAFSSPLPSSSSSSSFYPSMPRSNPYLSPSTSIPFAPLPYKYSTLLSSDVHHQATTGDIYRPTSLDGHSRYRALCSLLCHLLPFLFFSLFLCSYSLFAFTNFSSFQHCAVCGSFACLVAGPTAPSTTQPTTQTIRSGS